MHEISEAKRGGIWMKADMEPLTVSSELLGRCRRGSSQQVGGGLQTGMWSSHCPPFQLVVFPDGALLVLLQLFCSVWLMMMMICFALKVLRLFS